MLRIEELGYVGLRRKGGKWKSSITDPRCVPARLARREQREGCMSSDPWLSSSRRGYKHGIPTQHLVRGGLERRSRRPAIWSESHRRTACPLPYFGWTSSRLARHVSEQVRPTVQNRKNGTE